MTLVDYIYELLVPYADMPEFTSCVMKAMKKLGHAVAEKSMYVEKEGTTPEVTYSEPSDKSCRLRESMYQKDFAKSKVCSIECNE